MGYRVFFIRLKISERVRLNTLINVLRFSNAWKTLANLPYA